MDWNIILPAFISALIGSAIPAYFTYVNNKEESKNRSKELDIALEQFNKQLEHQINEMDKAHEHQLELMREEMKIKEAQKNNDISSQLALKAIKGEIDLDKMFKLADKANQFNKNLPKTNLLKDTVFLDSVFYS